MKRLILSVLLLGILLFIPKNLQAAEACPDASIPCTTLGQPTQCQTPCIRVVTQQGGHGGEAQCACQLQNQTGTVPLGSQCQRDTDCTAPGKYCWGEFNGTPICHIQSRADALNNRQTGNTQPEDTICAFANNNTDCTNCFTAGNTWTAIGCIPSDPQGFIKTFLGFAIGIAGGIAFILILFGGFQILTSAGNPEKLNAGKELVGAAISGLLLIIFSLFLLRLIGYNILGIPGFG